MNSRLCSARSSAASLRQAGSTARKVYLTKRRAPGGEFSAGSLMTSPKAIARLRALRPNGYISRVRIALVSPYSWTYPGGVTRHIESLAEELRREGHDVDILAPFDPDDALARRLHRGAAPQPRERPEDFVDLGRTIGIPANGAVSNIAASSQSVFAAALSPAQRPLRRGAHPRAGGAAGELGRALQREAAAGRDLPHVLRERPHERHRARARRVAADEPPARADRGLGVGGVDRAPLLRRPLPDRPQRRASRAGGGRARGRASVRCGSCSSARRWSARDYRCC